jgi:hypothetical protein
MRNWLFGLLGRILCDQIPWYQRKWWACSWLFSSPVSPFSISVNLDFPCTAHTFFPDRLSKHCQGLRCTFAETWITFDAVRLSVPTRNHIRPDTRLEIEGRKKSTLPPSCVKFCTTTPKIC